MLSSSNKVNEDRAKKIFSTFHNRFIFIVFFVRFSRFPRTEKCSVAGTVVSASRHLKVKQILIQSQLTDEY